MTEPIDAMAELDRVGAILLDRHFVYKSEKHGPGYINMDPMFPYASMVYEFCGHMMEFFKEGFHRDDDERITAVVAPATGGIVLAEFCALYAYQAWGLAVMAVWADKDGKEFVFERDGFVQHLDGKHVLAVEDLATTGGSVEKVCRLAESHGASIAGVALVCNRGGVTEIAMGVPRIESLAEVSFRAVDATDCELCAAGVPIIEDIGHAAAFKARHPDYAGGYTKLHDS